jgi:hypothetical protein
MVNLRSLIRQAVLLLLISIFLCAPALGQECTPDKFGKLKELTLGSISFKFNNSAFNPSSGKIVNFTCFIVFRWTAPDGTFTFRTDKGTIIEGRVTDFRLDGELAINQGADKNALNIRPNNLNVTLLITKPLKTVAYGGTVSLAAKEEILISNPTPISFTEKAKPVGTLQIRTSNRLSWQGATFRFPQLVDPIKLDLISERGATLDKEFELPLDTGELRITRATFAYTLPPTVTSKTFPQNSTNYRAVVGQLRLNELSTNLLRDNLSLQVRGLSGSGEFTGKIVKSSPLPVLFTGSASVASITGTAPFSQTAADIQGIRLTGLKLQPTPVTSRSPLARSPANAPTLAVSKSVLSGLGVATMNFQPVTAEPTVPQMTSADFYTTTPGQAKAMKELGIPTLSEQQRAAISNSRAVLKTMGSPNFSINYPAADIEPLIRPVLKKFDLQLHHVRFGRQEILFLASFQSGSSGLGAPDAMKLVFRISPTVETKDGKNVLVLRYKIAIARPDQTSLDGPTSPEDIVNGVSDQLGDADEASQDPEPLLFPLPTDITKAFKLDKTFTDPVSKAAVSIRSVEAQIVVSVAAAVLLVDEKGIHLVATLEAK